MNTELVSGRAMWMRAEFLTKPHGNLGDISVPVLSGAWQSRRLTSSLRGPSELRLQGGPFTSPTDAAAANMTKRAGGLSCFCLVFSYCSSPSLFCQHRILPQHCRERQHECAEPRKLEAFRGDMFLPLRQPAAGTGPCPQGVHGIAGEIDLKTNKNNKRKHMSFEVGPGY